MGYRALRPPQEGWKEWWKTQRKEQLRACEEAMIWKVILASAVDIWVIGVPSN
jgi:hypothetical protein